MYANFSSEMQFFWPRAVIVQNEMCRNLINVLKFSMRHKLLLELQMEIEKIATKQKYLLDSKSMLEVLT